MQPQHLTFFDDTNSYDVLIESDTPIQPTTSEDEYESYNPKNPRSIQPTVPESMRVDLRKVHNTIQGYTQYAIGAFKNLAIADVEEINLKFNLKISTEGGIPMLASGKAESDFSIEVKCKFPKAEEPKTH